MIQLYLAAPLFSEAQRTWNKSFSNGLLAAIGKRQFKTKTMIILPQELTIKPHYGSLAFAEEAYRKCICHLEYSTAVIAVLDGSQADDGTAFEVGYACAMNIPVIGIRSDPRPGEWNGCNIMLAIGCKKIHTYKENIEYEPLVDNIRMAARKEL